MNTFYIDNESYSGMFGKRPHVPEGEIWVFWRNGESFIVRGGDSSALPPSSPLFGSMAIYKFRRKIDFQWALKLFSDTGLSITFKANVSLFLLDPVQLIAFLHSKDGALVPDVPPIVDVNRLKEMDFNELRSLVEQALQMVLEGQNRGIPTLTDHRYDVTLPLSLSQLLPGTDLSSYVQGVSEFKMRGLEVRLVVGTGPVLRAYKELVQNAVFATQKELLPLQQEMRAVIASLEREKLQVGARLNFVEQRPLLQKELYHSQAEQIEQLRPILYPIIGQVIQQSKLLMQELAPPALVVAVFNDAIYHVLDQVIQRMIASQSFSASSTVQTFADDRAGQIHTLYSAGQLKGWKLLPSQEKVKEEISIDLGNETKLLLIVPHAYPKLKPVVTGVKKQGNRLPQSDINKVAGPVIQGSYDLTVLVQAVADKLSEPDPTQPIPTQ